MRPRVHKHVTEAFRVDAEFAQTIYEGGKITWLRKKRKITT